MNVATLYFSVWLIADLHASNTVYAVGNGISSILVVLSVPYSAPSPMRAGDASPGSSVHHRFVHRVRRHRHSRPDDSADQRSGDDWRNDAAGRLASHHLDLWLGARRVRHRQLRVSGGAAILQRHAARSRAARGARPLSGIGTAVGYVGTIVGLLLVAPFFNGALPLLGALPAGRLSLLHAVVPFSSHAGRVSTFVPTAMLFLLFSLPLFFFCRDHHPRPERVPIAWRAAFADVGHTLRDARRHPGVLAFIVASFLYQDAIGTIVSFMAIYAVKAMGFQRGSEITLFLVLTIPAIFGSYIVGRLVDRYGARHTLVVIIAAWIVLLVAMVLVPTQGAFWIVGLGIGLIFGGVPTAERPLLLSLVPERGGGALFQPHAPLGAGRRGCRPSGLGSYRRRAGAWIWHRRSPTAQRS